MVNSRLIWLSPDPTKFNPYERGYHPTPEDELHKDEFEHITSKMDPKTRTFLQYFKEEFIKEISGDAPKQPKVDTQTKTLVRDDRHSK